MEDVKNIDDFVAAVNNNNEVKEALNEFVKNSLPNGEEQKNQYFPNLSNFVEFLPNTIKSFFNEGNLKELGEGWKDFKISEIEDENDLEKLYQINLDSEIRDKIIKKFNMYNVANNQRLSKDDDVKKAIGKFKKILGGSKISADDFCSFIYYNIHGKVFSQKDIGDLLEFVDTETNKKPSTKWSFWNIWQRLKEQPSKKFIDFMVNNTDFNSLNHETLNITIIALMRKHPGYLKVKTKENMFTALKDILTGNGIYQEFSKALLGVKDIEKKINLDEIAKNTTDGDILRFVRDLVSNGINIKVSGQGKGKKFEFEENAYKNYSIDVLIACLQQGPELNQWIEDVFAIHKDKVKDELAKSCSLIEKIGSMDELISAKATAIKSFITSSKNSDRLKKVYGKLLEGENKKSLLKVKLNSETVKLALDVLISWFSKNEIIEFNGDKENGSIAQLKEFLANWKSNLITDNRNSVPVKVNLCDFIWSFSSKLKKDDFNELLDLDTWNLEEKNKLDGYELSNILYKIGDGNIPDKFLNKIKENKSVDFANLYNKSDDKCFGEYLFFIIYQSIRTSKEYNGNDKDAQKKAIKNVLENGEDYRWFREGLKTFFKDAKYEQNGKILTAKDIKIDKILENISGLKTLLDDCGMELNFNYNKDHPENRELTVHEKVIVITKEEYSKEQPVEKTQTIMEEKPKEEIELEGGNEDGQSAIR